MEKNNDLLELKKFYFQSKDLLDKNKHINPKNLPKIGKLIQKVNNNSDVKIDGMIESLKNNDDASIFISEMIILLERDSAKERFKNFKTIVIYAITSTLALLLVIIGLAINDVEIWYLLVPVIGFINCIISVMKLNKLKILSDVEVRNRFEKQEAEKIEEVQEVQKTKESETDEAINDIVDKTDDLS
ncbi:hypothetical protein [uncultured Clostridium sp.]|uniref:hypothetical protein n=1 Tax=uncultured Clostridium sp. TaxID=59620 RepID=UPI00260F08CB|nr:hypothetical protein [uncultured Clostridium sp.]